MVTTKRQDCEFAPALRSRLIQGESLNKPRLSFCSSKIAGDNLPLYRVSSPHHGGRPRSKSIAVTRTGAKGGKDGKGDLKLCIELAQPSRLPKHDGLCAPSDFAEDMPTHM